MGTEKKKYSLRKNMLVYNCLITFAALLMAGIVFVAAVRVIVGRHISRDLDFFLTETSHNMASRTEYLENTIYRIREKEQLMECLKEESGKRGGRLSQLQDVFSRAVDISSSKNSAGGGEPIADKAYLFDRDGQFVRTTYYVMVYADVEQSDGAFTEIYRQFSSDKTRNDGIRCYEGDEDSLYLAVTLYDGSMAELGCVIFELRRASLEKLMQEMQGYDGSAWVVYETKHGAVEGERQLFEEGMLEAVQQDYRYQPYTRKLGKAEYRVYREELNLGLSLIVAVPQNQISILLNDTLKVYILLIVLIAATAAVLFVLNIYRQTRPLKEVTDKLSQVRGGDFETKLPDYDSQEFSEISQVFNEMTAYIHHLVKQVYEKQISIKEMELKFLQTQMNPHFMFNVLNMIALQARMDKNEEVYRMISSFAQLIQAKIYRADTEKVQICQELEYVEYYLYLQSYRYGERLSYSIETEDEELTRYYIPKLCIQLIVENAVVHGIEPKLENGRVTVKVFREENHLRIDTVDNGAGFPQDGYIKLPIQNLEKDKAHNHVGLNNAHHIIRLMYGGEYGITVYSKRGEGTTVTIRIPFDLGKTETPEFQGGGEPDSRETGSRETD